MAINPAIRKQIKRKFEISFVLAKEHIPFLKYPAIHDLEERHGVVLSVAAVHGTLTPFDPDEEDWVEYTDRLSYYFTANGVTDAAKKRAILISCCGPATFRLMKSLVFPDQLSDFTFEQLVEKVKIHREPKASIIVRRFQFNSRIRSLDETVADYVAALRRLAVT